MSRLMTIGAALVFLLSSSPGGAVSEDARGLLGYQDGFESAVLSYRTRLAVPARGVLRIEPTPSLQVFSGVETRGGEVIVSVSSGALWVLDQLSRALALEQAAAQRGCLADYASVLLPGASHGIAIATSLDQHASQGTGRCHRSAGAGSTKVRELAQEMWETSLHYLVLYQEGIATLAPGQGLWRTSADPADGTQVVPEHAGAAHAWAREQALELGVSLDGAVPALVLLAAIAGDWPLALTDLGRPGFSQALIQRLTKGQGNHAPPPRPSDDSEGLDWTRVLAALLAVALGALVWAVYDRNQHRRLREYYEQSFYQTRDSLDVIATALGQHRFVTLMRLAWQQSAQSTSDDP